MSPFRTMSGAFAACIALALAALPAAAQQPQSTTRVWVGGGFGGMSAGTRNSLMAAVGQIVVQHRAHYFTLRAVGGADLDLDSGSDDSRVELGALYGRALSAPHVHMAVASGLALTGLDRCPGRALPANPYASTQCTTLGVPVVAELGLQPAKVFGFALQGFTNLNVHKSYSGIALLIQLGWMP